MTTKKQKALLLLLDFEQVQYPHSISHHFQKDNKTILIKKDRHRATSYQYSMTSLCEKLNKLAGFK